jgi:DNA-directed RNA polymerase specialized sigma24 family protein
MDELEDLDQRACELLQRLADEPEVEYAREFDRLLYEFVWRYLRGNAERIAVRVASYAGADRLAAPELLPAELAEVAHDATTIALRRVREKAARFDCTRGTPTGWVIGAAEYAYVEVAKKIVEARRSPYLAFHDPQDLIEISDFAPSTEEHIVAQISSEQALEEAAAALSEHEFAALRLVVTLKFSYSEAAEVIFGDAHMARAVDGLLTRGRKKLAAAWSDRKLSSGASPRSKVSTDGAENQGSEHV